MSSNIKPMPGGPPCPSTLDQTTRADASNESSPPKRTRAKEPRAKGVLVRKKSPPSLKLPMRA